EFKSRTWGSGGWLRLQYVIADYETGELIEIDDTICIVTTCRRPFGGLRWWFKCPRSGRRCLRLYLPLGAHHFWSRRAYGLGYEVERGGKYDRAIRRVAKLYRRLGVDQANDERPAKPQRMRWATYNRVIGELDAARRAADRVDPMRLALRALRPGRR